MASIEIHYKGDPLPRVLHHAKGELVHAVGFPGTDHRYGREAFVCATVGTCDTFLSATQARTLATALLVAADVAEPPTFDPEQLSIGAEAAEVTHQIQAGKSAHDVMQSDIAELLRVLGLGDHARPTSPHEVMQHEIIPAVENLVAQVEPDGVR